MPKRLVGDYRVIGTRILEPVADALDDAFLAVREIFLVYIFGLSEMFDVRYR